MIPTAVHGHMPFVKESKNKHIKATKTSSAENNMNNVNVALNGSISRMKVLKIRSDERLENIPDNIKDNILTKDRTWYAVVRALFRKSGQKQKNKKRTSLNSSNSLTSSTNKKVKQSLKNIDSDTVKFSSPINEKPIAGSTTIFPPIKMSEASRSKSMRLASIEEESDRENFVSLLSLEETVSLSQKVTIIAHDRPPLSDQMKRKAISEMIKTHEEVASLSSSSSSGSLCDHSAESLTAI